MSYSPLELPCIRAVVGPGRLGPLRVRLNPSHGRAHVRIGSTASERARNCVLLAPPHQVGRAARGRFLRWSRLAHAEAGSLAAHPRHALAQSHPRREGAGVCIRRARALCAVRAACRYGGCLHVLAFARGRMKAAGLRAGPSGAANTVPAVRVRLRQQGIGSHCASAQDGQSGLERPRQSKDSSTRGCEAPGKPVGVACVGRAYACVRTLRVARVGGWGAEEAG